MASTIFIGAKNFIKTERGPGGKYLPALNFDALDELKQVHEKIVVVSAVGAYRTGKSYLLNRLSKKAGGGRFTVGHKVEPETKGLWLMIIDHPTLPDHKLALLDTEGVGDTKKGDTQHDAMLFILTCLMSDTLIYNGLRAIDETAFEKLNFTAEMSNYLVSKTKKEGDDENFHKYFPELVYVVRDCPLDLEEDGREITSDEYFENALAVGASDDKTAQRAKTRNSIKKYFPRRKCFTLDVPASQRKILKTMDTCADDQLNEDFITAMNILINYILFESRSMTLQNGRRINGRQVAMLVETYVNAYHSNEVPNISSAMENLKAQENRKALEKAEMVYRQAMDIFKGEMPTESMDDVENQHRTMVKAISTRINADVILEDDEVTEFTKKLEETLNEKKTFYIEENERLSNLKCDATLKAFYGQLHAKKAHEYSRPGGYQEYRTDMSNLKKKYREKTDLGVMKEKKLLEFMEGKRAEEDGILAMDCALTKNQREIEEQKRKAEQAEIEKERIEMQRREEKRNAELLEERQKQNEEIIADIRREMKDEAEKRMKMEEEYDKLKRDYMNDAAGYEKIALDLKEREKEKEKEEKNPVGDIIKGFAGLAGLAAAISAGLIGTPVALAGASLAANMIGDAAERRRRDQQ